MSNINQKNSNRQETIAIVGIGCRFPGGINSPESFGDFLAKGKDAITDVPKDRWDLKTFYDAKKDKKGKVYNQKGGFLDKIDQFDPQFFGISPREADFMDPQQRLLLEVTWEAFDDGGFVIEDYKGSNIGVFVGLFMHDYENMAVSATEYKLQGPHSATGLSTTIAANRISHVFDLKGPSMVIDTACSSSLVAVHLACKSLESGESSLAVAGGVNIIFRPEMTMALCQATMLSPDGYCKSFDAKANGYVRSEGASMILLKRLSDAQRDGNEIYAVIRGSAINQDGKGEGLTVPNGDSQMAVLTAAAQKAGIEPKDIQYVEAHGTGTAVGDPIEAKALGTVLSRNRPVEDKCIIGSVKSNIGHTESAAGVAGLIKVALMIKNRQIFGNLHFQEPNPNIPFDDLQLKVVTSLQEWRTNASGNCIAGVNSFGFGGTNAHLILDGVNPPKDNRVELCHRSKTERPYLIPLSAASSIALKSNAESYLEFLNAEHNQNRINLQDIFQTTAFHKNHYPYRIAIVSQSNEELASNLESFVKDEKRATIASGNVLNHKPGKVAFVYSGMGQQWWAMGRELFEREPVFRQAIEKCNAAFSEITDQWSLIKEYTASEQDSKIYETWIAQPCIFSLQVGLTELWRSWGIEPDSVIGHSVGEIAAAYVSGALSLKEAVTVCFHRSRLQNLTAGSGSMLAVGLSYEEAVIRLQDYTDTLSIGAINDRGSLTLSGDTDALETFASTLVSENIFARFLKVDVPYHSPLMDPILEELDTCLTGIQPRPTTIPLVSTVTGGIIDGREINASYWPKNVRNTVLFADGVNTLISNNHNQFVEIGAHPVLANSLMECLSAAQKEGTVIPSLRRKEPEQITMLASFGRLYTNGYPIDWKRLGGPRGRFIKTPPYPWQKERYWNESEESIQFRLGQRRLSGNSFVGPQIHPLLGGKLQSAIPTWNATIDLNHLSYLKDHQIQGTVVFPGAAYVEMGIAFFKDIYGDIPCVLEEMEIKAPLILNSELPTMVQLVKEQDDRFSIYSKTSDKATYWSCHASGKMGALKGGSSAVKIPIKDLIHRIKQAVSKEECYLGFQTIGLDYGPDFQGIQQAWVNKSEVLGQIKINPSVLVGTDNYWLHPTVLDACFQAMALVPVKGTYLPVGIDCIKIFSETKQIAWAHARVIEQSADLIKGDINIINDLGETLVEVKGLICRKMEGSLARDKDSIADHLFQYQWIQEEESAQADKARTSELLSPQMVFDQLQPHIEDYCSLYNRSHYYSEVEPAIEKLSLGYIITGLQNLGFAFKVGSTFTSMELARQLGVVEEQVQVFDRFLHILKQHNILQEKAGGWECMVEPVKPSVQEDWKVCLLRYPASVAELTLIERCGRHLKEVLRGEQDPLSLIFPKDSATTEQIYKSSPTFSIYNRIVQHALLTLVNALPEGKTLRILEVGAGTGSMTSHLLPLLPKNSVKYVFSDISQVFLNQAKEKFQEYNFVEYQLFDLEKNPLEQGFKPNSFDLIIASDALHTTSDLKCSLSNISKLLLSNGLLLLVELSNPTHWLDLTFGLLKGWWLFSDSKWRPSHPVLSQKSWVSCLEEMGFADVISLSDQIEDYDPQQSVLLAQNPVTENENTEIQATLASKNKNPIDRSRPWIIFADNLGIAEKMTQYLEQREIIPQIVSSDGVRLDDKVELSNLFDRLCKNKDSSPIVLMMQNLKTPQSGLTSALMEQETNESCAQLLNIAQVLSNRKGKGKAILWIVTNGAQSVGNDQEPISLSQTPLWGLGRVIMTEFGNMDTRLADLRPFPQYQEIVRFGEEVIATRSEDEICFRDDITYIHRVIKQKNLASHLPTTRPYSLERYRVGSQSRFSFQESEHKNPAHSEVELKVHATGINFKDSAKVSGLLDNAKGFGQDELSNLGIEASGVITKVGKGVTDFKVGDEVVGLIHHGFSNYVLTDPSFLSLKPDHLTFEEAATITVAFLTTYFSLHKLASLKKGERVLIHTATGGVGLSAIQIAQTVGAKVLATAGTDEKRSFLKAMGIEYVGDSRSSKFAEEVIAFTNGEGVDVVLNTLAMDGLVNSIKILKAVTGRVIDLSNVHYQSALDLRLLEKGVSFYTFDLDRMVAKNPEHMKVVFKQMMQAFHDKELCPLPFRVFPVSDAAGIFRFVNKARHIGKLVASHREIGIIPEATNEKLSVASDQTYLITGGLGGFGIALAKWLIEGGAKYIVLIGRSGASKPDTLKAISEMEAAGAEILVLSVDVADENQVKELISTIDQKMPPLNGIIHAAMVLNDKPLAEMTSQDLKEVMDPKILGAWNLHLHTLSKNLNFFILFSSFASLVGNSGQGNYSAANYFLDALAGFRKSQGLLALTIGWGAIGEVGVVAQHKDLQEAFLRQGVGHLSLKQAWRTIIYGIENEFSYLGAIIADWQKMGQFSLSISSSPRFSNVTQISAKENSLEDGAGGEIKKIALPSSTEERLKILQKTTAKHVANVLGLPAKDLNLEQPFELLGFDSLMAVELSVKIEQGFKISLPKMVLLQSGLNVKDLVEIIDEEIAINKPIIYLEPEAGINESESSSAIAIDKENSPTFETTHKKPEIEIQSIANDFLEIDINELNDDDVDSVLKALILNQGESHES